MAKQSPSFLQKLLKFKYNFNPILQNRFVLYFLFLLALVQIVYFLNIWDLRSVGFFLIVGFLASFFSKNMVVILLITLALTNIMKYGVRPSVEGMENENEEQTTETKPVKEIEEGMKSTDEKQPEDIKEINSDLKQFDDLQKEIISGMKDIGGLLDKAEGFVEKYKSYDFKKIKNSKESEPKEINEK